MNKKYILIIFIIFILVSLVNAGGNKEKTLINFSGSIDYLDGEVVLNKEPAGLGSEVKTGDIVETGSDSFCHIIFNRGNVLLMEPDTILQINWIDSSLNLKKGSIASVFEKMKKVIGSNEEFKIITPSATAGIRGTAFYIKVEDEFNTYICTCNGSLTLYGEDIENFISTSAHHKAYRFTESGDEVQVANASMLYHDDPKMNSVAKVIGETIPWESSSY